MSRVLMGVACVVWLVQTACSSPPPPVMSGTASLTCGELEALAPGAGAACASDALRSVALDAFTVVDVKTRAPIVTLDRPDAWLLPLHDRVDRLVLRFSTTRLERAASLAQLQRTARAFVAAGWRCSDPDLASYLDDPRVLEALPYDSATASRCRLEIDHPDASPWRCDSPPGDPRLRLRLELGCLGGPEPRTTWGLILEQLDPAPR